MIYPKNRPKQTCDYWLIIPNQQSLCIETNIYQEWTINYKLPSGQLQNITVNGAMSITINRGINSLIKAKLHYLNYYCE